MARQSVLVRRMVGSIPPPPARSRFESPSPPICPKRLRTCVRATRQETVLHRATGARGDSSVTVLERVASPPRVVPDRRQPAGPQEACRALGYIDRPFRPSGRTGTGDVGPHAATPRAASRELVVLARVVEAALVRRRVEESRVRAVWTGREVEWPAHVADPRPHQRCLDRQPAAEPPDRVSKLRRHARDSLRAEQGNDRAARVRSVRCDVQGARHAADVLLEGVRCACTASARPIPRAPEGRAAADRAASL
jgi:hypothetical protein